MTGREKASILCRRIQNNLYRYLSSRNRIVILSLLEWEQHLSSSQRLQYEQGIGVTLQRPHLLNMPWPGDPTVLSHDEEGC